MNEPHYYAVIFTSTRQELEGDGYAEAAERMESQARAQPGFLGVESARGADGLGITISYWETLAAAREWGRNPEHVVVQRRGRAKWYRTYSIRICRVEVERRFERMEIAAEERP
jgi:heme-degrading monooxygenase HmoA